MFQCSRCRKPGLKCCVPGLDRLCPACHRREMKLVKEFVDFYGVPKGKITDLIREKKDHGYVQHDGAPDPDAPTHPLPAED